MKRRVSVSSRAGACGGGSDQSSDDFPPPPRLIAADLICQPPGSGLE